MAIAWLLGYANPRTRTAYQTDLADWGRWCTDRDLDPLAATRGHVDAYARSLETLGRSRATVARRLATLSSYYRYAVAEGYLPRSPVEHIRRPKVDDESQTTGLDASEAAALLNAASAAGPHEHALVCVLLLNGLRISEASGLDVGDLGEQRGHRTITVTRKGGKPSPVPSPPRAAAALADAAGERACGRAAAPGAGPARARRPEDDAAV